VYLHPSRRQFLTNIFQLTVLYDCIDNTMSHDLPPVLPFLFLFNTLSVT
jgi:hypothetical protein